MDTTEYEAPQAYRPQRTEAERQRVDLLHATAARDEKAARAFVIDAEAKRQAERDAEAKAVAQLQAERTEAELARLQTPEGRAELARRATEDEHARLYATQAEDAMNAATVEYVVDTPAGVRLGRAVDPKGARDSIRAKSALLLGQTADRNGHRA